MNSKNTIMNINYDFIIDRDKTEQLHIIISLFLTFEFLYVFKTFTTYSGMIILKSGSA